MHTTNTTSAIVRLSAARSLAVLVVFYSMHVVLVCDCRKGRPAEPSLAGVAVAASSSYRAELAGRWQLGLPAGLPAGARI